MKTISLGKIGVIGIAICLVIWLPLYLLKIPLAPLFLGIAVFIIEGLIIGWLHDSKQLPGWLALVVLFLVDFALAIYWVSFQVELYHPIYESLPTSMCDNFIIQNGGPTYYRSPEGLCSEELLTKIIEYNYPNFGDGENWTDQIMTALEDDFRKNEVELPRYLKAVKAYGGERERWTYERLTSGITPTFYHWIAVVALVFYGVVALGKGKGWNKTAIGVLIFWGTFQTIVGVIDTFPIEVRVATDVLYKQGLIWGAVLVLGPMVLKNLARLIELLTGSSNNLPNWVNLVCTILIMIIGITELLINPAVSGLNNIYPEFIALVLNTPGMSAALAIKSLTLGYLVSSGLIYVVIGLIPEEIRELL